MALEFTCDENFVVQSVSNFDLPRVPEGMSAPSSFGKIWPEAFEMRKANDGKWIVIARQGSRASLLFEAVAIGRKRAVGEFREALKKGKVGH